MDRKEVKEEIDRQFKVLAKAASARGEASTLFGKAFAAALQGERARRVEGEKCLQTPETAARFFVLCWFREPRKVSSALEASKMELDCLYGSALRELFDGEGLVAELDPEWSIDYMYDIAGLS